MSLIYTWNIQNMKRNSSDGGVLSVIYIVHATDNEEKRVSYIMGTVDLTPDSTSESFISYEDLSEDIVLTWVHDAVNKSEIESELQNKWNIMYPSASGITPSQLDGTPWAFS